MTQEIKLTKGYVAIVDDLDFNWLSQYSWHTEIRKNKNTVYAKNSLGMRMHTLIIKPGPGLVVNHIDRNGLNNIRDNLELLTYAEHAKLSSKRRCTYSSYRGVYKYYLGGFRAALYIGNKHHHIGVFNTEIEAAQAYNDAGERLLGKGNFIMNNLE